MSAPRLTLSISEAAKFHMAYQYAVGIGHPYTQCYEFAMWFTLSDWDDEMAAHREWILT